MRSPSSIMSTSTTYEHTISPVYKNTSHHACRTKRLGAPVPRKETVPSRNLHLRRSTSSRYRPPIQHPAARMGLSSHPIPGGKRCSLRHAPRSSPCILRTGPIPCYHLSARSWSQHEARSMDTRYIGARDDARSCSYDWGFQYGAQYAEHDVLALDPHERRAANDRPVGFNSGCDYVESDADAGTGALYRWYNYRVCV